MTKNLQKARIAFILCLFGTVFAVGGFWLLQPIAGWLGLAIAVASGMWLHRLSKIQPMPRPGLDDRDRGDRV
ncbi:MAG: hypothetical protein F6J93_09405 [Oscillatoria sp. SIO1A7]|nr:hypothetical protein [Oscillatoria sp. SIO1A7]